MLKEGAVAQALLSVVACAGTVRTCMRTPDDVQSMCERVYGYILRYALCTFRVCFFIHAIARPQLVTYSKLEFSSWAPPVGSSVYMRVAHMGMSA